MPTHEEVQRLCEDNYRFFQDHLDELKGHWATNGKFILMGTQTFEGAYDTFQNAYRAGLARFESGTFSIQEVTDVVPSMFTVAA